MQQTPDPGVVDCTSRLQNTPSFPSTATGDLLVESQIRLAMPLLGAAATARILLSSKGCLSVRSQPLGVRFSMMVDNTNPSTLEGRSTNPRVASHRLDLVLSVPNEFNCLRALLSSSCLHVKGRTTHSLNLVVTPDPKFGELHSDMIDRSSSLSGMPLNAASYHSPFVRAIDDNGRGPLSWSTRCVR